MDAQLPDLTVAVPQPCCPHQSDVSLSLGRGYWPPGCAGLQLLWRLLWPRRFQLSPPPIPAVHILEGAVEVPLNTATPEMACPLQHPHIPPAARHPSHAPPRLPCLSLTRRRMLGLGEQIPFFPGPCPPSSSTRMGYSSHFPLAISWGHMMLRKAEPRVLSDCP